MAYGFTASNYVNLSLQDLKKAAVLLHQMQLTAAKLYLQQMTTGSADEQALWREYQEIEGQLHSIIPPAL
jgi:hypothetical protein